MGERDFSDSQNTFNCASIANRLTRERGEDGFIGLIALRHPAVIGGVAVAGVFTVLAAAGNMLPDTSEEALTISGKAALGKVTIHAKKQCVYDYDTKLTDVGQKRSKTVDTGFAANLPLVPDDVEYMGATVLVSGNANTELCYTNFDVTPDINSSGAVTLNVGEQSKFTAKTTLDSDIDIKVTRSPLLDAAAISEASANLFGFEGVENIKDLDNRMSNEGRKAAEDRALDCLDEAEELVTPGLKTALAEQWVKTANGVLDEVGSNYKVEPDNVTVELANPPVKALQNAYEEGFKKLDKDKGEDFSYIEGTSSKCDTSNAVVLRSEE